MFFLSFSFLTFIYLFTERKCAEWGGVKGEERERISGRLPDEHGARCRAQSHDPEIMT